MKELLKVASKKLLIWSIIVNMIYSLADYGEAFALLYFGTSPLTLEKIVSLTICIFVIGIIMLSVGKLSSYLQYTNDVKTQTAVQKYYFDKLNYMSMKQISNTHTGYMYKLITNVSNYFYEMIWQFQISVIPLLIGGTSILIMVCQQSIVTGIICIIISFLAVFFKYKMIKNKQVYQKATNEAESRYNATFIDFIQNIISVKKLNIGSFCDNEITEKSNKYLKATKISERKRADTNAVFTGLMYLLNIVVLISTIIMVSKGYDGLPYLLFYMSALGKLYFNLNHIVKFIDANEKFKTTKKQLDEYFKDSVELKIIDDFEDIKLFNGVFSYSKDSTKIMIPEFLLKKGEKISIMGESGQGKTTIMNILAGLYPLQKGELKINNKKQLKSKLDLVFVSQEVDLFDMNIRDNLCLGKNISDEKIFELLEDAGLKEWYNELPDGLNTMIGERGIKISVGQKQRLNLIRGILMDKELYFFDEPTSNLDSISEEKIINMIDKYLKNKTILIVTHKPKVKELCNRHYIFENHMMKEVVSV